MSAQTNVETLPETAQRRESAAGHRDRISSVAVSVAICFQIALLVLINAYPHRIGVIASLDRPDSFVSILTPAFGQYVPWVNSWLGLALALNLVHLGLRRWNYGTRWADLGVTLLGCYVLWLLVQAPPLVGYDASWLQGGKPLAHIDQHVVPAVSTLVTAGLWLALILTGLNAVRKLLRLVIARPWA